MTKAYKLIENFFQHNFPNILTTSLKISRPSLHNNNNNETILAYKYSAFGGLLFFFFFLNHLYDSIHNKFKILNYKKKLKKKKNYVSIIINTHDNFVKAYIEDQTTLSFIYNGCKLCKTNQLGNLLLIHLISWATIQNESNSFSLYFA